MRPRVDKGLGARFEAGAGDAQHGSAELGDTTLADATVRG